MIKALKKIAAGLLLALSIAGSGPAIAAQDSCILATTGTVSGLTFVQNINTCLNAVLSVQSGATAPTSLVTGMLWRDTSTSPQAIKQYDGTNWSVVWWLDATNHLIIPPVGGGTIDTVSSATITDLWAKPQSALIVSGVTTITQFANASATVGTIKRVKFTGITSLTYDATKMILPTGSSITTAVGDYAEVLALTNTNVAVINYTRADGTALNASSNFLGAVFFNSAGTFTLAGNTNDWTPAGFSTQNVVRLTCSSAINVTGLVAPATDGKVVVIDNVGATNNCTFTSQDAASTAANRFAFDRAIAVRPSRSIALKYDSAASRWRLLQDIAAQPVAGGFKNLRVFNVATAFGDSAPGTPNSQMKIATDAITVEDINGGAVRLTSVACTISASGSSFSSGAGGIDTGALSAGNWYSFWVIYAPSTNTVSCLASLRTLSFGTPGVDAITLPSTYTFAARVGWDYYWTNNAVTGFQRIVQYGRRAQYVLVGSTPTNLYPLIASGANGGVQAAFSVAALVPPTAAVANASMLAPTSQNVSLGPNSSSNPFTTQATFEGTQQPSGGNIVLSTSMVLETMNVYYAAIGGSTSAYMTGWEDNL